MYIACEGINQHQNQIWNKHSIKYIRNLVLKRIRNFIYKYKYFYKFIVLTVEYNKNKWKNQILYINKNGVFSICVK